MPGRDHAGYGAFHGFLLTWQTSGGMVRGWWQDLCLNHTLMCSWEDGEAHAPTGSGWCKGGGEEEQGSHVTEAWTSTSSLPGEWPAGLLRSRKNDKVPVSSAAKSWVISPFFFFFFKKRVACVRLYRGDIWNQLLIPVRHDWQSSYKHSAFHSRPPK